jgi:cell division protease FtsH
MVCEFGMSEALGPLAYPANAGSWDAGTRPTVSEATAQLVDREVRELVMEGYETARQIIATNRRAVQAMADELLVVESLDADGIKAVIARSV